MKFNTRIAPSPTGMFHLGTARTAYFNWLAARGSGGRFVLRIDDTDENRNNEDYVKVIFEALDWLGLDYDEVYRQSDRHDTYRDILNDLVKADYAYLDDGAYRLRLDPIKDGIPNPWTDGIVGPCKISDNAFEMIDGLVLWRSDDTPTYHFASVVDDITMDINRVIRGDDHKNNTAKQIAIAVAIGDVLLDGALPIPAYDHLGLIMVNKDGKRSKMSKRDDAASLLAHRDAGVSADAMRNFMLRLGWGPVNDANFDRHTPFVSIEKAREIFLSGSMKASPVLFDEAKLKFYAKSCK